MTRSWLAYDRSGIKVEEFALVAIRCVARKPTIHEVFADVQADFKASGMTEDELGDLPEQAVELWHWHLALVYAPPDKAGELWRRQALVADHEGDTRSGRLTSAAVA